jgi:hypothetical protein
MIHLIISLIIMAVWVFNLYHSIKNDHPFLTIVIYTICASSQYLIMCVNLCDVLNAAP